MGKSRKNDINNQQISEETPKNRRTLGLVILLIFAVLLIGSAVAFYEINLMPVGGSSESIIVEIPNGATISDVANILEEAGVIRSALVFRSYAGRHSRGEKQIQAANYEFNRQMSAQEIFNKMLEGDAYLGEIKITVPEGKNLKEIAKMLEDHHVCDAQAFQDECKNIKKYKAKYPILSSIPDGLDRDLEGYLFPATYYWNSDTKPSVVVNAMVSAFVDYLTPDMEKQAKEMGKTVDEIIIMASIIELEIKMPEDRANCASVYYNRLKAGMPLQADITVDYALGSKHAVLTTDQTQVDSPYNTYINYGLPIGPIGSPGVESIKAALNPAKTNYLYYVSDLETGKTYFNETYEGHLADCEKHMK